MTPPAATHTNEAACLAKQQACQKEMHEKFTPWKTFVLVFSIQAAISVGSYGYTWICFMSSSSRATVSEGRSSEMQRGVDKAYVRGEGMELTLVDVRQILRGIQTDLGRVEKAVIRLEARNERLDAPAVKP